MNDPVFDIGAPGLDTTKIMEEVRASVADKLSRGVYADACLALAERTDLGNIKNEEQFLAFYIECLRDAVFVDINDFEIIEKRSVCSGILVALKRLIWKMLKFYTYRLWSQQNQVNGLLLSAIDGMESKHRDKIKELEEKIAKLEARSQGK